MATADSRSSKPENFRKKAEECLGNQMTKHTSEANDCKALADNGEVESWKKSVTKGNCKYYCSNENRTPLLICAVNSLQKDNKKSAEMLSHIIDCGANVNATDATGNTALHYACMRTNPEAAIRLINAGASLDSLNGCGKTAIVLATSAKGRNHSDVARIVQRLISKGANPTLGVLDGKNAAKLASDNGYEEAYQTLQLKAKAKRVDELEKENMAKAKRVDELEKENMSKAEQEDELEKENMAKAKRVDELEKENMNLREQVEDLKKEKERMPRVFKEEFDKMEEENEAHMRAHMRRQREQRRNLERKLGLKLEEANEKIKQLEKENKEKDEKIWRLEMENTRLKEELDSYQSSSTPRSLDSGFDNRH